MCLVWRVIKVTYGLLLFLTLRNSFTATKHFVSQKEIAGQNHFYAIFDVIFVQIQLTRFSVRFGAYFMPVRCAMAVFLGRERLSM